MLPKILQAIGVVGTIVCIALFVREPSFPTPDKILVFLVFVFMIFHQAVEMLKRFLPFIAILLVYESFRGLADGLNKRVEYMWMVDVDRWLFGGTLPTTTLQKWWWHGQTMWYDFVFYLPYMLHFVIPISLALFVWKYRPSKYWQVVVSYVTVSFSAFFVFLAFPAAPPWIARDKGLIEPITRISSEVWAQLGIQDFPTVYNQISPNPVAAVPSLHAAYATIFALYVSTLFLTKWRWLSWIYPALIYVGTVYQGEHYAIDEILGALLAVCIFLISPWLTKKVGNTLSWFNNSLHKLARGLVVSLISILAPSGGNRDVSYGKKLDMLYDIYPANYNNSPVVIFWHGGAWTNGDKNNYLLVARQLRKIDTTVVLARYPKYPDQTFPGFVEDAQKLIQHIRKFYPQNRIYLMGHSSGGHTALVSGMTSKDSIAGVIAISTPCTIGKIWQHIFTAPVSSGKQNPGHYVDKSSRGTRYLLIHGDSDKTVLANDSITLNKKLQKAGLNSELVLLKNVGHAGAIALYMLGLSKKINKSISHFVNQ